MNSAQKHHLGRKILGVLIKAELKARNVLKLDAETRYDLTIDAKVLVNDSKFILCYLHSYDGDAWLNAMLKEALLPYSADNPSAERKLYRWIKDAKQRLGEVSPCPEEGRLL